MNPRPPRMVWARACQGLNFINAIDTNIYAYSLSVDEPAKQQRALDLSDRLAPYPSQIIILWQVAGEFFEPIAMMGIAGKLRSEVIEGVFRRFFACFRCRFQASWRSKSPLTYFFASACPTGTPCCWRLAACETAGDTPLYSKAMDAGTNYYGLAIVNPFA